MNVVWESLSQISGQLYFLAALILLACSLNIGIWACQNIIYSVVWLILMRTPADSNIQYNIRTNGVPVNRRTQCIICDDNQSVS